MIDPRLFHPSVIFQYFNQHSVLTLGDEATGIIAYIVWDGELIQTSKPLMPIDLGINRISADEPEPTFPGKVWVDISTSILKVRNEADDGWYSLGLIIGTDVLAEQTVNVPHTVPTGETRTVGTYEQLAIHGGVLTLVGDLDLEGNSEVYILA